MDLFAINPVLKCYRGRPPGDSPKLCNLDSCINGYLHKAVDFRVRYTHSFHKLDPKRFSITTPKKGILAYPLIFDPIDRVIPSSEWIISDTYHVITSIKYIVESKGFIIPDVNNVKNTQTGRRRGV